MESMSAFRGNPEDNAQTEFFRLLTHLRHKLV